MKHIWIVTWYDDDDDGWYQVVTTDAADVVRTLVAQPEAHVGEWEIDSQGKTEMVGP